MKVEFKKGMQNINKRKRNSELSNRLNKNPKRNQLVQKGKNPSICSSCKKSHGNKPCLQGQSLCFKSGKSRQLAQSFPEGAQEGIDS